MSVILLAVGFAWCRPSVTVVPLMVAVRRARPFPVDRQQGTSTFQPYTGRLYL